MSIEFCGCGRIKGDVGLYHPRCYECMNDLRKVRPEWFDEKGNPKPMKKDTIISLPVEEPAAAPALHEWPVGDQVARLQSRVAVLEGLLKEYRTTCFHPFSENVKSCALCMQTDSILAPAPLTEGE